MSLFENVWVPCPACGESVEFEAVSSVNADRRPDLRDAILNGTFQQAPCGNCKVPFRLDPQFTYLHTDGEQWLVVHPFGSVGDWENLETRARQSFDRSYGPSAARAARSLGAGLKPRLVFGWPALREKIFAAANGLDDIELELTKMAVLRNSDEAPITANTELRLVDIKGDQLIMAWIVPNTEEVAQTLGVPRGLYDEIAGDRKGWQTLRDELVGNLFIDMQRLMLPVA